MSTKPSVEMCLCAFHLGKWELDESVEDAYHRALDITSYQFHQMLADDYGALKERHERALYHMYKAAGMDPTRASEGEMASLRKRLIDEARKGGMRFPS